MKERPVISGESINMYLFIDLHGNEHASNEEPKLVTDWLASAPGLDSLAYCGSKNTAREYYMKKIMLGEDCTPGWYTTETESDYGEYMGTDLNLDSVILPRGTIKKLTGTSLEPMQNPIKI